MENKEKITFIIFTLATIITISSQSIITTGLTYIMSDFNISSSTAQLTYSLYLLVLGVMIPPTAYIVHKFEIKRILEVSLILYILGSILSYFSPNITFLLIGRILQAAGTGILMPIAQVLVFKIFPEERWSVIMGIFGFIVGIVPALSPTLGGYIIDISNWRVIFELLTILGILTLILTVFFVKFTLKKEDHKLDVSSLILSVLACTGIMLGFSNIGEYGISLTYVIFPLILGIVSLIIFTYRQLKIENPLINLKVLKNKYFISGTAYASLLYFTMCGINVMIPLFAQNVAYFSATSSGLILLPATFTMIIFNFIGPVLSDKIGINKVLILSSICSIIGYIAMTTYTISTSFEFLVITQLIRGMGAGLGLTPSITWTMSVVSQNVEDATAVNNTLRQVIGAIGSAISVVLMTIFANGNFTHNADSVKSFSITSIIMMFIIIISLIIVLIYIKPKKDIKVIENGSRTK